MSNSGLCIPSASRQKYRSLHLSADVICRFPPVVKSFQPRKGSSGGGGVIIPSYITDYLPGKTRTIEDHHYGRRGPRGAIIRKRS